MPVENGYTYTLSGSDATITDYDPTASTDGYTPTIPTTFNSGTENVVAIGANAFDSKSLTSVTITHSINLGAECFKGNGTLTVTISADLTTTGLGSSNAPFENCTLGSNLTISAGVTNIPDYLFYSCGITSVSFPSSITDIGIQSFLGNTGLTGTFSTWASLSSIGSKAFQSCDYTVVNINHNVDFGSESFRNNGTLTVNMNNSCVYSFGGAGGLFYTSVLGDNLTITSGVTSIPNYMFYNCGITSVTFPSTLTTVGTRSFDDNNLTEVILPANISSIGNDSFSRNDDLADVYVYNDSMTFGTDCLDGNMSALDPGTIHGYAGSTAETYADSISNYVFAEIFLVNNFHVGQYTKIYLNSELRGTYVVNQTTLKKMQDSIQQLNQKVNCIGLNNVPARRTIRVSYSEDTTASVIVNDMIDDYLSLEGIEAGEIHDGTVFKEEWVNECINIAEVLDECANKSGFQWYIDKDMKLNFFESPATISWCTYTVDSDFYDIRDVSVEKTINNYTNKLFVVGGNDFHGDLIFTVNGDIDKQNEMQQICGNTGVYGIVERNSAITEHDYKSIETGSSPTQVNYTAHPMTVGDYFWNITRDAYSIVTSISTDSFECISVPSQASSDEIEVYVEANNIGRTALKKQSTIPEIITFKSFKSEFYASTALTVSISDVSVSGVYNIDEVQIKDRTNNKFITTVKANLRIASDFSTQKSPNYSDFFRGF